MNNKDFKIGFIGLGGVGQRMARRLMERGFHLTVFDRDEKQVDAAGMEAMAADSARTLAACSNVIISCLTDDRAVLGVYAGARGALSAARPGTIVIEMSTVLPETSHRLSELARERQVEVLDVPISGSTPAAEEGTLILFGGGNLQAFDRCRPIFETLAQKYFHVGGNGAGNAMKLVVNTLLGVNMEAIAEAVTLGEHMGLATERMLEVLAQTAVVSRAHQGKLLRAARNDYSPQFPLRLMEKDFGLILRMAGELGVPMPATMASSLVNQQCTELDEERDFSAVIEEMRRRADPDSVNRNPRW